MVSLVLFGMESIPGIFIKGVSLAFGPEIIIFIWMWISGELIVWAALHLDLKTLLGCVISGHSYHSVSNLLTQNLHLLKEKKKG